MWRWVTALLFLSSGLARADEKPKKDDAPSVWPPAPTDESPKKPAAGKKDDKEKDKPVDGSGDEPLPHLTDGDGDAPPPPPPPKPEPPEDRCQAPLDECTEDCTIEHTNDDTTKPGGRQPLVTCINRCNKAHASCEERRALGLEEKRRDATAP